MAYQKFPDITEYRYGNNSRVLIRTNVPFLEVTLKFCTERFFSTDMGVLYIIDAILFSSFSDLLNHLRRVNAVKPDMHIIIIDDNKPTQQSEGEFCPWILSTKDSIESLISCLKALNSAVDNFNDIVTYYENRRKMGYLDPRQAQMLEWVCKGESIDCIASRMNLSPKTVYYNLRKVSAYLGMKNLSQLIVFMLREHYVPFCLNAR
ncbi:Bacterial regulatory proteins, luxR family [Cedecea neteri]|uniref:Bacterial regulatory proteins, luxR family n=1 Tax=Cedecea neteri TaxID=158822 RepID=A0A291E5X6_9ENTR|nr:helix-turn-helix domain-containing protein [Cedecea neteri]ATF95451.1 helix-turn-helix transcriptional regulator [Cedecea neteri]SQC92126.1 Bacterial regulatory proteins, luxR family [Cedecea neteri]